MKVTRSLPSAVVAAAAWFAFGDTACSSDSAPPAQVYIDGDGQAGASGAGPAGGASGATGSAGVGIGAVGPAGGSGGVGLDSGCAEEELTGTLIPANLLFVVDRSGSMNCNLPSDGQTSQQCELIPRKVDEAKPSKWEIVLPAFQTALDTLQMNGNASVGLTMFPVSSSDCTPWNLNPEPVADIDVAPLDAAHNTAIDTFLDNVDDVGLAGKTPLAGATILGYRYLQNRIVSGSLAGNYFLVLMSDGFESCAPDVVPELYANPGGHVYNAGLLGIRTFVIGVPGSEDARGLLSEIAYLGGTARSASCSHDPTGTVDETNLCHFDMTQSQDFAGDLSNALNAINRTVLSCELDVPTGPRVDRDKVNITLDGVFIKQDGSPCATANGWQYNTDRTKIELCGQACEDAKQAQRLRIVLGCSTITS